MFQTLNLNNKKCPKCKQKELKFDKSQLRVALISIDQVDDDTFVFLPLICKKCKKRVIFNLKILHKEKTNGGPSNDGPPKKLRWTQTNFQ